MKVPLKPWTVPPTHPHGLPARELDEYISFTASILLYKLRFMINPGFWKRNEKFLEPIFFQPLSTLTSSVDEPHVVQNEVLGWQICRRSNHLITARWWPSRIAVTLQLTKFPSASSSNRQH
jgi:hypothetical protein